MEATKKLPDGNIFQLLVNQANIRLQIQLVLNIFNISLFFLLISWGLKAVITTKQSKRDALCELPYNSTRL